MDFRVCTDENEGLIASTVKEQGGFLHHEAYSSANRELMEDVELWENRKKETNSYYWIVKENV